MLTFKLNTNRQTFNIIVLRRKNLRFLSRTNLIKTRSALFEKAHTV